MSTPDPEAPDPEAPDPEAPDPEAPDFDALAAAAHEQGDVSELWRATYALDEWVFLATGEEPRVQPFIGVVDEQPCLVAFTSGERAHAFAVAQGTAMPDQPIQLITQAPAQVVAAAPKYIAAGVHSLIVNPNTVGYLAPMQELRRMLDFFTASD